jgi:murein DD-endopeptidase MepM/ murein hydrolase activator NlpD
MSPAGTPEFAITDGALVRVKRSSENGWNRLGVYTAMLKAAYDVGPIKEGDLFYYAHLEEKSMPPVGSKVRAGQKIGTAGDTGEGPEVTWDRCPSHLHLGWYDGRRERSTLESGTMDPYPILLWLERNSGAVSGGTDVSYCEAPQGTVPQPSTGESYSLCPIIPAMLPT